MMILKKYWFKNDRKVNGEQTVAAADVENRGVSGHQFRVVWVKVLLVF